ncbi:MAG: glycosyltransferase family 4 protein [Deltaproteobacteria bacterium]
MKSNLLHIIQGGKGGTLEYLKHFLPLLDKDKFDITVICHGEIFLELKELGFNVVNINMERAISPLSDIRSLLQISNYLKTHKVDLMHLHSSKAGFLGRLAAKWHGIPCVYNPHGWSFNIRTNSIKKNMYKLLERMAASWTDKIVAISGSDYLSALEEKICTPRKLELIENGIDLTRYVNKTDFSFKQQIGFDSEEKIVGMCARLTEQKNPLVFIDIAKCVTQQLSDCKFVLVGDGELREQVENRIKELHLDQNVLMTGWTTCPEKYVNIFDVGLLTSKWEGFGLALAEYMACGKPVVASRIHGIPYVVRDTIDGFLCEPDNVNEFAEYIIKVLTDDMLYEKISEAVVKRAEENFNILRVIKQHERLYEELLAKQIK